MWTRNLTKQRIKMSIIVFKVPKKNKSLLSIGCLAFCCVPLHRADESQQARNSCPRLRFSVWSLSYRCRITFSTQSDQPCRNLSQLYSWLIRSFTDPVYTCSIFVCGPLLIVQFFVFVRQLCDQ